jgi:hypothetical protein
MEVKYILADISYLPPTVLLGVKADGEAEQEAYDDAEKE